MVLQFGYQFEFKCCVCVCVCILFVVVQSAGLVQNCPNCHQVGGQKLQQSQVLEKLKTANDLEDKISPLVLVSKHDT